MWAERLVELQLTTRDLARAALLAMAGALPLVLFAFVLLTLLERQQDTALRDRLRRGTENLLMPSTPFTWPSRAL